MKFTDRLKAFMNFAPTPQTTKEGTKIVRVADRIIAANMENYKLAVNSAKSQYWQQREPLYQIYQNTFDFDSHFQSLLELRLINTVGKKLKYVVRDKPVNTTLLTDSPEFEKFLRDLLLVRFWGLGAFEFLIKKYDDQGYFSYQKFPLMNVNPYDGIVYTQAWNTGDKIPLKGNKLMLGDPNDLGLMLQISLLSIYKRANRNNWANYNELAGDNFMLISYPNPVNPQERTQFRDSLQERGKNAVVDVTNGAEITFPPSSAGNAYQTFEQLNEALNDEMARLILGQTMTTDDGSSYSQAEVHERMQETIFDGDCKYLLNFLNYDFYEVQQMYGIPPGGRWQHVQSGSLVDEQEIEKDLKLKQLGIIFTDAEIRKKYNIEAANDDLGTAKPEPGDAADTVAAPNTVDIA